MSMQDKHIKVSIIIPVYNAGQYFRRCLDTIVNQTLQEIEVILVLDCPTDGSDKIAEEYAAQDERIKLVYNETNIHIGLSRNKGLELAQGEYVAFSDHDDYRELTMYEELYNEAKRQDVDIVTALPTILHAETNKLVTWEYPHLETKYCREYCLSNLIGYGNYTSAISTVCYIHNMLYRRELLTRHNVRFVDTRTITPEDVIFQTQVICVAHSVSFYHKSLYYHVLYQESTGHSYTYVDWQKRSKGMLYLYQFLQEQGVYEAYELNFLLQARKQLLNGVLGALYVQRSIPKFLQAFRTIKSLPFTRKAFAYYSIDDSQVHHSFIKRMVRKMMAYALAF